MLSTTGGTGALLEAPLDRELTPTVRDVATLRQSVLGLSEAKAFTALQLRNSEPKNGVDEDFAILVAAAVNGDRAAVERVLRSIRPLVVRYCRARVGGQEKTFASADDVAQEVCLAVLTALPSYRDQGRPFLSFVYGIASHKVADAHRSSARNRSEPVPEVPEVVDHTEGPEAQVVQAEFTARMARLLDTLPERQREVLMLRVVVGLSAEETAEVVGSTPGAVRVAQHRALNRLHKVLTSRARSDHGVDAGESSP
ncbi:MAG: sigma-70 family RNA polymerase sigma factor [Pseudonocardiaceae bacterium]